MISKVGGMVYTQGGVVTNVQSYGQQDLAYKIKGVQDKYDKVGRQICCCIGLALALLLHYTGLPAC